MKLNVFERLKALQILPKEGNIVTLRVVQELGKNLSFKDEEFEEFEIKEKKEGKGGVSWNAKGKEGVEIEIGPKGHEIIAEALKDLDKQKKLTFEHISLYEKFVKEE